MWLASHDVSQSVQGSVSHAQSADREADVSSPKGDGDSPYQSTSKVNGSGKGEISIQNFIGNPRT